MHWPAGWEQKNLPTMRRLMGLEFEGITWPDRFVATNIEYPFLENGFCNANMVVDPVNWCVIGRLGRDDLWRLLATMTIRKAIDVQRVRRMEGVARAAADSVRRNPRVC